MSKLEVKNLNKSFNNGQTRHIVLNNLNFSVQTGEYVSLLGPSGCGKTTLLSIMAGFQKADAGSVLLNDYEVVKPCSDRAFVFQNYALFPWMTLKENILYPMKRQRIDKAERETTLKRLLAIAHLEGKENLYPHQLSGGMKQRTAVIRALACRPEVLLMDEPMGAVDFQMRQSLQEELEQIFMQNQVTVIMVTHDVEEAVFMSDRVIVMSSHGGHIIEDLAIKLSRPRERRSQQFNEYRLNLMSLLQANKPQEKEKIKRKVV
jgi:NitT/TauT family transport system ATP-binding protein